jgi:HEAT repeat protein
VSAPLASSDIDLVEIGPGTYRLTPPRWTRHSPVLNALGWTLGCLIAPCIFGFAIAFFPVVLGVTLLVLGIRRIVRESWELGSNRLEIRHRGSFRHGLLFTNATCRIERDGKSSAWVLRIRDEAADVTLFRAESLNKVVGIAAAVRSRTGWEVSVAIPPEMLSRMVHDAMTFGDQGRMRFLLEYDETLPILVQIWKTPLAGYLQQHLARIDDCTFTAKGLGSSNSEARAAALELIGLRGQKEFSHAARAALADPDETVRKQAAFAAGALADGSAVPDLCLMLSDASEVAIQACWALGGIRDPRAVTPLSEVLSSSTTDPRVRTAAALALGSIGDPSALEVVAAAIDAPAIGVRSAAAQALGRLGHPGGLDALEQALMDVPIVAASAIAAVGEIAHARSAALLRQAFGACNPEVGWSRAVSLQSREHQRALIVTALGHLGMEEGVEVVFEGLDDEARQVRLASIVAMGQLAHSCAVPPLRLKPALKHLGSLSERWLVDREMFHAARTAAARIQERLAIVKDLPLASHSAGMDPSSLPLAADFDGSITASERSEAETVQRVGHGNRPL